MDRASVAVFDVVEFGDDLRQRWDRLARDVGALPFVRPGWVDAWAEKEGREVRAAIVHDGEDLQALIPLVVSGKRARTPADWHVPAVEIVASDPEAARALAQMVAVRFPRVTADFVLGGSVTAEAFAAALTSRRVWSLTRMSSPYVDLGSGWEEYRASLPTKKWRELRRRRRRLEDLGAVSYEVVTSGEWREMLEEGLVVEASGWKDRDGTAVRSNPSVAGFYRRVAAWAESQDLLRLGGLRVGGRLVAFDFALDDGRREWLLKTGFDPELSKWSPGMQLRAEALRAAFDRGLQSYEFTGSAEAWKDEWTARRRDVVMIDGYPPGWIGAAAKLRDRLRRAARVRLAGLSGKAQR